MRTKYDNTVVIDDIKYMRVKPCTNSGCKDGNGPWVGGGKCPDCKGIGQVIDTKGENNGQT